ncbi:ABC transporter permease [Acholeplasma granularum]|uniref:ABC transporter permease n=1 Tax=Acholeplasma granularum TaxID=264635 RepID=UPI000470AAF9|nr:ABC transporter permease [Acholeplasma granularum]
MKAYPKLVIKDLRRLLTKLLAIVFIVTLGVAFLVGLLTTAPNMRYTIDKFYKESNTADIIIQKSTPFSEDEIQILENDNNIEEIMPYFMIDENITYDGSMHMSRIMLLDFESGININQLRVVEGRLPEVNDNYIEVVVEESQQFLYEIPIGYEVFINDDIFKVVGIVNHPWYFAYVQEISYLTGKPIESMIYVDKTFLPTEVYTQIAVTIKDADKYNTFSREYEELIDNKLDNLKFKYPNFIFTNRYMNQSFVKFSSDVKIVEVIAIIFPLFFFLITILVSMSSMTRIIHDQRIQIGTLKSLGYSNFKIISKYLLYVLLASGIGVLLGIGLGIYSIPLIVYNAYIVTYNLPVLAIEYHVLYITLISLTMILSVLLVTFFSIKIVLKERTSELLKQKSPKPGKKILLEYIPFIWNKLKFKYKSTFRNIFRQKRNLFLMLIGISGSTALLLAGFGIKNSVDFSGDYQFNKMYQYDIEITTSSSLDIELLNNFNQLKVADLTANYNELDYINVIIPSDENLTNTMINFKDTNNDKITFDNQSVFITESFARLHNIHKGDLILLTILDEKISVTVTDIIEFYFGDYIYIAKDLINNHSQLIYNKIYVKTNISNPNIYDELLISLDNVDTISLVQSKQNMMSTFEQTSSSMNSVIILLVIFASILAIIINYNLTLITIGTRQKEMATLKVLGYHEKEVAGYVFRETIIISSVAIILGLLLGRLLHYFIISQIIMDGMMLKNEIHYISYIITAFMSYLYLLIVYLLSIPKINKVDMLEALKSFE